MITSHQLHLKQLSTLS